MPNAVQNAPAAILGALDSRRSRVSRAQKHRELSVRTGRVHEKVMLAMVGPRRAKLGKRVAVVALCTVRNGPTRSCINGSPRGRTSVLHSIHALSAYRAHVGWHIR